MAQERFSAPDRAHFDPLKPDQATAEGIADRLRLAIDFGDLRDGQKLPREAELAGQLKVSVFALREALGLLRGEDLVITRAGRGGGTMVTSRARGNGAVTRARQRLMSLSAVALRDLADWKSMLVGDAAELAANRASDGHMRRGNRYIDCMRDAADPGGFTWAENKWLIELSLGSQSLRLNSAIVDLHQGLGTLALYANQDQRHREQTLMAIDQIQKSIEARDSALARQLARSYSLLGTNVLVRSRLRLISEAADV